MMHLLSLDEAEGCVVAGPIATCRWQWGFSFFACPRITSALVFRALGALTRHALFLGLRALISAEHFLQCETNLTRVQAQVEFHVFITNQRGKAVGLRGHGVSIH
jgi:hypothetical protein